mmetsp:Transcript_54875/g.164230  ORF Transcript_54875/g.164230 Transcript_54875/m.164230 type:complete len:318 (-) Transcript_54875:471-1424(-)
MAGAIWHHPVVPLFLLAPRRRSTVPASSFVSSAVFLPSPACLPPVPGADGAAGRTRRAPGGAHRGRGPQEGIREPVHGRGVVVGGGRGGFVNASRGLDGPRQAPLAHFVSVVVVVGVGRRPHPPMPLASSVPASDLLQLLHPAGASGPAAPRRGRPARLAAPAAPAPTAVVIVVVLGGILALGGGAPAATVIVVCAASTSAAAAASAAATSACIILLAVERAGRVVVIERLGGDLGQGDQLREELRRHSAVLVVEVFRRQEGCLFSRRRLTRRCYQRRVSYASVPSRAHRVKNGEENAAFSRRCFALLQLNMQDGSG